MNYIIFNADGSVQKTNFTDVINQNNDNENEILVKVEGLNYQSYNCLGIFVLPDGTTSEVAADYDSELEGYVLTLTLNETKLAGLVFLTIQIKNIISQKTLYTYRVALTINESADLASVTLITLAQYNAIKDYVDTNFATKGELNEVDAKLPQKRLIGTFNTNDFTLTDQGNYVFEGAITLNGGLIQNSDLLIITWGGCFAICPIPVSGPGRVVAALWNANGESQVVRVKYELTNYNERIQISLAGGFVPPSNFTGYIFNYKIA